MLYEAVQDGIRQRRVASGEGWMPGVDRQLADHQRRADPAAIVDHLQQILLLPAPVGPLISTRSPGAMTGLLSSTMSAIPGFELTPSSVAKHAVD